MRPRLRSFLALSLMASGIVLAAQPPTLALADWPVPRHDVARTGLADGSSDIVEPVPYWRAYLGGSLGRASLLAGDIDGDGANEVVYATGGRVVAHEADGSRIWTSRPLGVAGLYAIADFDGNGLADILTVSRDHAYLLAGPSGDLQWAEPDGEMGTLGAVRVGDLDHDGLPDLVVQECGCCGVNSGNPGSVYGFAGGTGAAQVIAALPFARCGGSRSTAVVDVDGDGESELVLGDSRHMVVFDPATQTEVARSPELWDWVPIAECDGFNIDGVPGEEIVCLQETNLNVAEPVRRIFVLRYDASGPALTLLWNTVLAPNNTGETRWIDPVADLDGDGSLEIVVSARDAGQPWTTRVYDAATGELLASVDNELVAGRAVLDPAGRQTLLTTFDLSTTGWRFDRSATNRLSVAWKTADRAPLDWYDLAQAQRTILSRKALAFDLDGNGVDELFMGKVSAGNAVYAVSVASGSPSTIASFDFPARFAPLNYWPMPPLSASYAQLAVARNDGFLTVFDDALRPLDIGQDGGVPGIRIGGYYASGGWRDLVSSPLVAALEGGPDEQIVVRDSRSTLIRLDASDAALAVPPRKRWELPQTLSASVVPGLDGGAPGLVCVARELPLTATSDTLLRAHDAAGAELWSVTTEAAPLGDVLPARLDDDGVPDLALQWGEPANTLLRTRGVDGATGATLWDAPAIEPGAGRQPAGMTLGDFDGDGIDDVYTAGSGWRVFSGGDGTQLAVAATGTPYGMATLTQVDGDPGLELAAHGSYSPVNVLDDTLTTVAWSSAEDDRPYPYGAVVDCSDGRRLLVTPSWAFPARLKFTELVGAGAFTEVSAVYAGGRRYDDTGAAAADGAFQGQLTSANAHADLRGDGEPTVLVGSTDGWLYGVTPCDTQLAFAVDFGVAVGESVFGDTDGDGRDEILVSVADGYLYNLRDLSMPAPQDVWDLDVPAGITDRDVATVDTTDTLWATWAPVAGASGYEVAVADAGGAWVSDPIWQSVAAPPATIAGLALQDQGFYRVAVRALGPSGASPDASSNGVFVRVTAPPVDVGPEPVDGGNDTGPAADTGMADTSTAQDTAPVSEDTAAAEELDAPADTVPGNGGSDEGCGCSVRRHSPTHRLAVLAMAMLVLAWHRRRLRAASATGTRRPR